MAINDLNGAFERVYRAEEHLFHVEHELSILYGRQEEALICQFNAQPPHHLSVKTPPHFPMPPLKLGILIGEVCYNLRSAMDYLVFALAKLDSGGVQEFTQFPICDTKKLFTDNVNRGRLNGINAAHVAALEGLQPYNGIQWTKLLRDFSNRDKHKEFILVAGGFAATGFARIEHSNFDQIQRPIRRAPRHPIHGKVDVKLDFTASVTFSDGAPIVQTLEEIKAGVRETLNSFKPECE